MKLFLDESVPKIVREVLFDTQASVVDVSELGLSGVEDETVFGEAQKRGMVFVTVDLRFVTRIFLSKKEHCGVILLRYKGKVPEELLNVLKTFIRRYKRKTLENTLVVLDKEKFRVRKLI